MNNIEIKTVKSRSDLKRFVDFHYDLYEGSPYDVPDLFSDVMDIFTPGKNAALEFCTCECYIAYQNGKAVGRVAAIINPRANEKWQKKQVRFGWIDYIDDLGVLKALLTAVRKYGQAHGMTEMIGPMGFTDMDPEGMLTQGFDRLGTMPTIYNYDYYPRLMEQLQGWTVDNKYVEFYIKVPTEVPAKLLKLGQMIEKRYNLHVRKLTRSEIFHEGWGQRVFDLLNDTYADLYGFSSLTQGQIDQYVSSYLRFADLDLITLVEDWNVEPHKLVGFGVAIPSMAAALQKCRRGRLLPLGWWHLIRAIKMGKTEGIELLLVGVLPEYRSKGANALFFTDIIPQAVKRKYKWCETNVEMETNDKVQSQWTLFNPELHKRRNCYKFTF